MIKNNIQILTDRCKMSSFDLNLVGDRYLSWLRNEKINKYLIKPNKNISKEEVLDYCTKLIKSQNNIFLSIFELFSKKHIGNVRIGPIDFVKKVCNFSIMIGDQSCHGKGYGSEIVESCIDYSFESLNMKKFTLSVDSQNLSAIKIYKKNNMILESIKKQKSLTKNDMLVMSITRKNHLTK